MLLLFLVFIAATAEALLIKVEEGFSICVENCQLFAVLQLDRGLVLDVYRKYSTLYHQWGMKVFFLIWKWEKMNTSYNPWIDKIRFNYGKVSRTSLLRSL